MNDFATLRRLASLAIASCVAATMACAAPRSGKPTTHAFPAAGVNFAGAEYGKPAGKAETDFHFPGDADFAWAQAKGFVVVRLPFLWERIQPKLEAELNGEHLALLTKAVEAARAHGLSVILDLHNYGGREGDVVGSKAVPNAAFADLWRRLAERFAKQPDVVFGLMNEPHDLPATQWAGAAQAAVDAIREAGACNLLLIPGANWTGAHSWNAGDPGESNASAMARIHDAGPHDFEFHQYLDSDWSGSHAQCRPPAEAVAALSVATDWLHSHKSRGFLGEFGASADPQCLAGLDAMLAHMRENSDVWSGWAYWAAGAWWPRDYPLSIQPLDGKDRPQMAVLAKWIGKSPAPRGCPAQPNKRGRKSSQPLGAK